MRKITYNDEKCIKKSRGEMLKQHEHDQASLGLFSSDHHIDHPLMSASVS